MGVALVPEKRVMLTSTPTPDNPVSLSEILSEIMAAVGVGGGVVGRGLAQNHAHPASTRLRNR